jgi:hypothetical protein
MRFAINIGLARLLLVFALAASGLPVAAAEPTDIEQLRAATAKLIGLLVEQGVLTREKADAVMKDLSTPAARREVAAQAAQPAASGAATIRVPYVPEFVRKDIKDELRAELVAQAASEGWAGPGSVPDWVRRLTFEGDLRPRYEFDRFASGNAPAIDVTATNSARSIVLQNTTEDRSRLLVRGRLGLTAKLDDNWSTGLRISTGSASNPVSENLTLGSYGNRLAVQLDRAYARYRYGDEFNVVAGRFGNPWFGTDLVWANDLSFDGVATQWTPKLNDTARGFLTLAALPVQEIQLSSADKWLFGAQAGLEAAKLFGEASGRVGLGFFSYSNIVGQTSPAGSAVNEFTAPQYTQKGNTYYNISSDPTRPLFGLASNYRLVNLTGSLDLPVLAGSHVLVTGDFVRNVGYNRAAVSARVGADVAPKTTGFMLRVAFGNAEVAKLGDWQLFAGYKHVERDAVLDAFTDSDFHLGGTDARGYFVGGSYGLGRNTAANLRLLSADAISGAPLAVDVIQFDLLLRF